MKVGNQKVPIKTGAKQHETLAKSGSAKQTVSNCDRVVIMQQARYMSNVCAQRLQQLIKTRDQPKTQDLRNSSSILQKKSSRPRTGKAHSLKIETTCRSNYSKSKDHANEHLHKKQFWLQEGKMFLKFKFKMHALVTTLPKWAKYKATKDTCK